MYDGRHKISAKYIPIAIVRFLRQWVFAIIVVILGIYQVISEEDFPFPDIPLGLIIAGTIALFFIPFIIAAIVQYKKFRWELTDEEIHIYKGLISRKQLHVPYKRIHSADINAKLIDRILGVVTLKMDTAGGGKSTVDVQIPALEISVAEALKNEVFRRKAIAEGTVMPEDAGTKSSITGNLNTVGDQFSEQVGVYFDHFGGKDNRGDESADGNGNKSVVSGGVRASVPLGTAIATDDRAVYRLSPGELILSGISSGSSILVILIAFGGLSQIAGMLGEYSEKVWDFLGNAALKVYGNGILAVIGVIIVILLISMAISVIGKLITLWDFTVKRSGDNIEVRRGLLEHNASSISVKRIQAIRVNQGFIKRIIGYAEIKVERVVAITNSDSSTQTKLHDNVLHPFIKKKKIPEFMAAILPEYAEAPAEKTLTTLGGSALRRSFFRYIRWTLIMLELPVFVAWYILGRFVKAQWSGAGTLQNVLVIAGLILFIYLMITAFFAWRGRAVGHDSKMLVIRSGAYGRQFTYIPRRKIQYAMKSQSPFQKRAKLATITAHSAAPAVKTVQTIDVTDSYADDYLEWVEKHTAEVRSRQN
ncbi:MAG: PH domain-containing protein [Clostridiales Family XIII bacterium]|jgi:putative membrane protein|nr:PH domain-containing protein [Clostridiales Family XIII bacterium]